MNDNIVMEEYKDISQNMRQYGNMRFAQLTLFAAMTAGLLSFFAKTDPSLLPSLKLSVKLGGLIIAFLFGVMEERAADYWHHCRRMAETIEKRFDFKQYINRPARKVISATNAARILYAVTAIFWIITIAWPSKFN